MILISNSYNIPKIKILEDFEPNVPKNVGTIKDFENLSKIVSNSKLCFMEFTIGNTKFSGLATCYYQEETSMSFILLDSFRGAFRFTLISYSINLLKEPQIVIIKVKTID